MASATTTTRSQRTLDASSPEARPPLLAAARHHWRVGALGGLCALGVVCFLGYPTYPTYDSLYALLWGRELLHLQLPNIDVYRAPTEHPLAIAFGALCSLLGEGGARAMVLGSVASFLALVVGSYRVGRECFGELVGVLAALLVLSRFFVENLALQGYLDVTFVALVVWGLALALQTPRRDWGVLWVLCAAGLLRPEGWALSVGYWVWIVASERAAPASPPSERAAPCSPPRVRAAPGSPPFVRVRVRAGQLAVVLLAPLVWMGVDALLAGDPLHSLRSTAGLAHRLGRTQDLHGVLSSTWGYLVRIDKLPVVLGSIAGCAVAMRLARRRALLPAATAICLLGAFVVEGVGGASVLDRYMVGGAVVLLPFCALALGGWALLRRGSVVRGAWMGGALALAVYGGAQVNATLSLSSLRETLDYHVQLDQGLSATLRNPRVERSLGRCGVLSLPNNKLIPNARWVLAVQPSVRVVARSQARELQQRGERSLQQLLARGSVAVYPLAVTRFFDAVAGVGEEAGTAHPPQGFRRIYASHGYVAYANC